jgi:hypothetical protein
LPPWLLDAIISLHLSNPAALILAASNPATKFDNKYENNAKYLSGGKEQLTNFVKWAWAALANRITNTRYYIEPNYDELVNYNIQCHNEHIILAYLPLPPLAMAPPTMVPPAMAPPVNLAVIKAVAAVPLPDVLNMLRALISCQADAMERINMNAVKTLTFQKEKETKKKDRFKKIHPLSKQLILFALASNPYDVPDEIEDSCECFINAPTHGVAKQELQMHFKGLGLGKMAYTTGLTLNLYSGKFLYAVCNNPSNFSCFS